MVMNLAVLLRCLPECEKGTTKKWVVALLSLDYDGALCVCLTSTSKRWYDPAKIVWREHVIMSFWSIVSRLRNCRSAVWTTVSRHNLTAISKGWLGWNRMMLAGNREFWVVSLLAHYKSRRCFRRGNNTNSTSPPRDNPARFKIRDAARNVSILMLIKTCLRVLSAL